MMRTRPTSDQLQILNLLLDGEPKTRIQLAAATGWARNTVVARLNELIEVGWVTTDDVGGMRGRPAAFYVLNAQASLLFVANFGLTRLRSALTDLLGRALATEDLEFSIEAGPQEAMRAAAAAKQRLSAQSGTQPDAIVAAAVTLPSPLDHPSGLPLNPASMPGWTQFTVAEGFAAALGVPTSADNDANAMALGVQRLAVPRARNLVCINIEDGVGAGIISSGVLQRGERGLAGEIGHVPSPKAAGRPCDCGNEGCLTQLTSNAAIIRDLRTAGLDVASVEDVTGLSGRGNPEVLQTLREAGRCLGEVLVAVSAVLSPSVIVLTGALTVGDHIASGVREVIFSRSVPAFVSHLVITTAPDHRECAINGGAALALEALISRDGDTRTKAEWTALASAGEGLLQAVPA
ncbi:ROK family transcriptional regulator [Pseudarthrobacter sp. LMD1-1-1.1]|uniref:ROK family transcriptional regulator n=1 Tax=Pseudarthrobacter sp. LMD1-1-1.1 TaxID=3135242 RepID=UPI003414F90F